MLIINCLYRLNKKINIIIMDRIYIPDMSDNNTINFFRTVLTNPQLDTKEDVGSPIPISNSVIRSPSQSSNKDFCLKIGVEKINDDSLNISIPIRKDHYTCCVCFDEIENNIYSCINYHSMCKICDRSLKKRSCPLCRNTDIRRNHILEYAVDKLKIKCPNKCCGKTMFKEKLNCHIMQCKYSKIKCKYCTTSVTIKDYVNHLKNNCLIKFNQVKPFEKITLTDKNIIVRSENTQNLVMCIHDKELYCFTDGNREFNSNYIYFKILGNDKNRVIYIKLFVNNIEELIHGKHNTYTLLDNERTKKLKFSSFVDNYKVGTKCMICNKYGAWKESIVIKKSFKPERILIRYSDTDSIGSFLNNSEWVIIDNTVINKKIKSIEQYSIDTSRYISV